MAKRPRVPSKTNIGGRFSLALIIVIPTFVLVGFILFWPGSQEVTRFPNGTQVASVVPNFGAREDALKTVLAVVGVWVGAIVAFYFSSENLEKANEATLQTIELLSPLERLRQKLAKDHMLTPPYYKKPHDTIGEFKNFLKDNPIGYPFEYLLIADDKLRPLGVLNDHEVEEYIIKRLGEGKSLADVEKEEILAVMIDTKEWKNDQDVRDNFVKVHPETPLSVVKDLMKQKGVRLAYVINVENKVDVVLGVISMRTILDVVVS